MNEAKFDTYHMLELREKFAGKVWCFVPVISSKYAICHLGIAIANEPGYSPVPISWCNSEDYVEVSEIADDLNKVQLRLGEDEAMRIEVSTHVAQREKNEAA